MGAAEIAWDPQQRAGIRLQSGPGCQTYRDLHNDSEGHAAQQLQLSIKATHGKGGGTCCPTLRQAPLLQAERKCRPGDPLKYGCLRAELADPQRSSSACLTGGPA